MSRSVKEWCGKTDDTVPPPRVRLRVLQAFGHRCYICKKAIHSGEYWQCDHIAALINSGENRESNLAPACRNCCYGKTAEDLAIKKRTAKIAKKAYLRLKPKGRPMMGTRASGWRKRMDGTVERRG